ncbi:tellurite resistance TerB family protein [Nostoc sp. FACHB-152]|uniref:tellurite resistance TerB family protein n=1 Tax=unclassified Nostoc TaxID=2593658 RepID=UPI00168380E2|nr:MULTISPECIES: tellurite resistance TerB family protein [unclassified Nostoc]MBD2448025.1 tellurite resistance TerB family protein [Nostoc sp. FACHB-152]MBD2466132.1 tellurite resistance TerB family protein [Nostoc sp. FACHB-145]
MPKRLPRGRSASSVALEPEVAIAIIGLFSAAADEGITSTEEYALSEMLESVSQFEDYTDEDFAELGEKVAALIEEEDPEELIAQAINSLPNKGYREAAYITAILVVGIDEEVFDSEQDYISELQEALNISDERAQELIDEVFGTEEEECEDEDEE